MIFVGIDPGQNGGLVAIKTESSNAVEPSDQGVLTFTTMPETERGVWQWFENLLDTRLYAAPIIACIEKVGGYMPGKAGNIGSSMFNFGWGYGGLRMAMVGNGIEFDEVHPRTWMAAMGVQLRQKGEKPSALKHRIKAQAEALYPRILTTLATSDAVLIATFCRWKHEGRLP